MNGIKKTSRVRTIEAWKKKPIAQVLQDLERDWATDEERAAHLHISTQTLYAWQKRYLQDECVCAGGA